MSIHCDGVTVEDRGSGEVVFRVGEKDFGIAIVELVVEVFCPKQGKGCIVRRQRIQYEAAAHDVCVAGEGLA